MKLHFEHQNFFHPSVIPYRGKLMMVMQKQLAMDRYTVPYFSFSENDGEDWSEPQEIAPLKQFEKCADFRRRAVGNGRTWRCACFVHGQGKVDENRDFRRQRSVCARD